MTPWLAHNWFELFSSLGILGGLSFTTLSLRSETKTRRVANLLAVTANYREIWQEYFRNPQLARVLDATADLLKHPVTHAEELFVGQVIFQVSNVFYAMKHGLFINQEGSQQDIAQFFSLPVPKAVWTTTKRLQNQDFAAFIDAALKH